MSFPTTLSPWYVVQRLGCDCNVAQAGVCECGGIMEYYTNADEGKTLFQSDHRRAMLFMSLAQASRVAASEGAEVRVLATKEEAAEFGRA